MPPLIEVAHPLVQVAVTGLRSASTPPADFRRHLREVSALLFWESTRDLGLAPVDVRTPLAMARGAVLERRIVLAPILRAALGMLDGVWPLVPHAAIAHLGICRDEATAQATVYYHRLPPSTADADVFLLDPMLATGHTAVAAVDRLKAAGAHRIRFLSVIACRTGIDAFHNAHPDVPIITAAIDPALDHQFFIVPGLGDAGDRSCGT